MKIVFFGYDYTLDIVQRLMTDGHDILQIFTFPCDNMFSFNAQIHDFATHFKIPISEHKIEPETINTLIEQGCDLFLCAGYPHKIPDIDHKKSYGINVHPTLLPRARGVMPLPYIIMQEPEAAGFTIHKLVSVFDAGDILFQHPITIDTHTDVETLAAQIAVHTPPALSHIVENITKYWDEATPQDHDNASSYDTPNEKMRILDWNNTVAQLLIKGRAFGRFGVMGSIVNNMKESQNLAIFNFTAWTEKHDHPSGTLLRSSQREIIISVQDGYVCLKEFQVLE